jgi:hypothetical protein
MDIMNPVHVLVDQVGVLAIPVAVVAGLLDIVDIAPVQAVKWAKLEHVPHPDVVVN